MTDIPAAPQSHQAQLTELVLNWSPGTEDDLTRIFGEVLSASKAALWLQDPMLPQGMLQALGTFGIGPEERPLLDSSRLNLNRERLAQRAQGNPFTRLVWTRFREEMGDTEQGLMDAYNLDTLFCCALTLPGNVFGLLYAATTETLEPSLEQIALCVQIAQATTTGLHRKHLQQQAEQANRRLEQIMSRTPDLIFTFQGLTITSVNPACLSILGYTQEEMVGRPYLDFLPPDEVTRNLSTQQQILHGARISDFRNRYWHKDGYEVHLEWNTAFEGGDKIIGIARDITRRVEQERELEKSRLELQRSEQRFQRIADSAPVLIFMSGALQGLTFINQTWLDFVGKTRESQLGYGWLEQVHPDHRSALKQRLSHPDPGPVPATLEFQLCHHEKHYRWMLAHVTPVSDENGKVIGLMGAVNDIHERKLAEELMRATQQQLQELNAAQNRFVADAAHELRTPLAAIQGNLDVIFRYADLPESEKKEILQDVHHSAIRLSRLVNDMLQLARGKAGIRREDEVQLHELALSAWRDVQRISKGHVFGLEQVDALEILGDSDRLKQLLLIVLENAVKYTPLGGEIRMGLVAREAQVHIQVSDTGVGIREEDLQKVFERFYRVNRSRDAHDPGGTGLGLPIARWIVEAHEGSIALESVYGKGTTVHIRLPLLEPEN